ncbi:MAG: APC family permease, partial [Marmoricola sp.]
FSGKPRGVTSSSSTRASGTSATTTRPDGGIGLWSCVAFAVGTMVGAGVFVLSGIAVKQAGPAALISFVLAAVLVLLSALSFTVVASRARQGESGYAYVGRALGGFWRFFALWAFYVGGVIGVAFVLGAFGSYVHDFFIHGTSGLVWAVGAAVVLTLLNLGPADLIGRAETALVAIKVGILCLLIVFAFIHIGRADLSPFVPDGASSVITTSGLLFVAYLGFNVVCSMAPEVRDARRTIPRAIVISMGIVTIVYLGVVVALLAGGISSYDEASVGEAARRRSTSSGRGAGSSSRSARSSRPCPPRTPTSSAPPRSWCGWPRRRTSRPSWVVCGTVTRRSASWAAPCCTWCSCSVGTPTPSSLWPTSPRSQPWPSSTSPPSPPCGGPARTTVASGFPVAPCSRHSAWPRH